MKPVTLTVPLTLSVMRWLAHALAFALLIAGQPARADDGFISIPTRPDVSVPVYWMPRADATATVMLLPGGGGGLGDTLNGQPGSANFLVRSRHFFAERGLNVAVVGRPSDINDLDYRYRTSAEHVGDLSAVTAAIARLSGQPLWMIGTSRGTVSAVAAAVAFGNTRLAGIVLSSSIVNMQQAGAVPLQQLDAIRIPVLVLHHEKDGCVNCRPHEVPSILRGLHNAPVKKQVMVNGGANPRGDPCSARHWHGYIGMEEEAVDIIASWIRQPVN